MNETIDIKNTDNEQIFIKRLLEIAQMCNDHESDSCVYEVNTPIGKVEVRLEFSYEIKDLT